MIVVIMENINSKGVNMMSEVRSAVAEYFTDLKNGVNNLITCDKIREMHDNGDDFVVLDIRKPEDFEEGHIDNAVNIFWSEVGEHIDELPKDKRIVVVCYTGQSAGQVVSLLRLMGYTACSLKGGMTCDRNSLPMDASCDVDPAEATCES